MVLPPINTVKWIDILFLLCFLLKRICKDFLKYVTKTLTAAWLYVGIDSKIKSNNRSLSQEILNNKNHRYKIIRTMHNQNEENFKSLEQKN